MVDGPALNINKVYFNPLKSNLIIEQNGDIIVWSSNIIVWNSNMCYLFGRWYSYVIELDRKLVQFMKDVQ